MKIENRGRPDSKIWFVMDKPYPKDMDKGIILSSGLGYTFKKTWELSKISEEPYVYSLFPTIGATYDFKTQASHLITELETYKPPIICLTNETLLKYFIPELEKSVATNKNSLLEKYNGSLLKSSFISHDHYITSLYPPDYIASHWDYHEIYSFIDLGHVREELDYFIANGSCQPIPQRNILTNPDYHALMSYLTFIKEGYEKKMHLYVSTDIETIRTKAKTYYAERSHPGYPYTCSFATDPYNAISFSFWDYESNQSYQIWKLIDHILYHIPQIGQNFFQFDAHFLKAMGFRLNLTKVEDTRIRHHILWPEMSHTLQFQTKHYTRQPYYKDEGKTWTPKNKTSLMHYNCLDTLVTYEIFLEQEKELIQRGLK